MDQINAYLMAQPGRGPAPRLRCKDGTSLSIQAGEGLYSTPRTDRGPWTQFEVGYPSSPPPERWAEYAERYETPCDTVYAYVPLVEVQWFVAAHGGLE